MDLLISHKTVIMKQNKRVKDNIIRTNIPQTLSQNAITKRTNYTRTRINYKTAIKHANTNIVSHHMQSLAIEIQFVMSYDLRRANFECFITSDYAKCE